MDHLNLSIESTQQLFLNLGQYWQFKGNYNLGHFKKYLIWE